LWPINKQKPDEMTRSKKSRFDTYGKM